MTDHTKVMDLMELTFGGGQVIVVMTVVHHATIMRATIY